jgi:hypothetical protein
MWESQLAVSNHEVCSVWTKYPPLEIVPRPSASDIFLFDIKILAKANAAITNCIGGSAFSRHRDDFRDRGS